MMQLDFYDNDGHRIPDVDQQAARDLAVAALEKGRHVIITEDYRRLHHAKVGDTIELIGPGQVYHYGISGIVWSPGIDFLINMTDMGRVMDQRTAGMVFGSLHDAQHDFGAGPIYMFGANLKPGVDRDKMVAKIRKEIGDLNIRTGDLRTLKDSIQTGLFRLLALLTTVAFAALGVAALGVTNTVMAGIRTRQWQFGILRSIGLARPTLMRMILAEAILLGCVGVVLGISAGLELAVDAREMSGDILGYLPPMVLPWGYIGIGVATVLFAALIASWWPAKSVANAEPLLLLQSGRAAA